MSVLIKVKMNCLAPDPLYTAMKRIFTLHRDQKPKRRKLTEYGEVLRKITKTSTKGRIAGGQSKQSHLSGYE